MATAPAPLYAGLSPSPTAGPSPVLRDVYPRSGPLAGGTPISLLGNNLTSVTRVVWGNMNLVFVVKDAQTITATTPPASDIGGIVQPNIYCYDSFGQQSNVLVGRFTYADPPPPLPGGLPAGGSTTYLWGDGSTTTVANEAATADHSYQPASGTFRVATSVTDASGAQWAVDSDVYQYGSSLDPLDINIVTPDVGPESGGQAVVLEGTGFDTVYRVVFRYADAPSFIVVSGERIECVTPPATYAGLADVQVFRSSDGRGFRLVRSYQYGATPVLAVVGITGMPGYWAPIWARPPADIAEAASLPAAPSTPWMTGQWIEPADGLDYHWDGTAWMAGKAP